MEAQCSSPSEFADHSVMPTQWQCHPTKRLSEHPWVRGSTGRPPELTHERLWRESRNSHALSDRVTEWRTGTLFTFSEGSGCLGRLTKEQSGRAEQWRSVCEPRRHPSGPTEMLGM